MQEGYIWFKYIGSIKPWNHYLLSFLGRLGDLASSSCLLVHQFRAIFQLFARTTINLLLQLSKLASNVSCVTVQHRCISSNDLAWMVQNNPLGCEGSCFHWWVTFAVTSHIATTNIFDRHVLDIEAQIVPRKGFTQCFMARFENTNLHTTHRDSTYTTNFIDILGWQTQGFGFKQDDSTGIAIFTGDFPSLEPWKVSTWLQHVVTIPARNWHTCYCVGVVTNFLNVGADSLNNFLISLLTVE
ncbi:hypothetical protein FD754_019589 [Muntiacus muntjak]|uniref:Uncharacterized protein n=1 Tax=Muntiacus muntjak TaxID=9888 RepID=A0A5N3V0L2_MUNMU|nr:hypothetical protein FD754_019589 [Muntiacus muntjak]